MKRVLITVYRLLFTGYFLLMPAIAANFDTSVDDEIRKNYNPSKLEEDMNLPSMPKILQEEKNSSLPTKTTDVVSQSATTLQPINKISSFSNDKSISTVLKKGTKVKLKLMNNVSDKTKRGTTLNFVSLYPVTTTYFTIPAGTTFKGSVVDSHPPQFTANGGLIVIKIDSVVLNDGIVPVSAYVTKANSKHIFLNNIKGKRKFAKSMYDSTKPSRHFFGKMMRVTKNLATDGSSIVVAPFSVAAGVAAVGGNVLASPVLALFHKGNSISIDKGSTIEVKLLQDVFIYN